MTTPSPGEKERTLTIYGNNTWQAKVTFKNFLPRPITTRGKWYIQGYQLVTVAQNGARGTVTLLSPSQLQWGDFLFIRCG